MLISILAFTGCRKTTAGEEAIRGGDTIAAACVETDGPQTEQEQPAQMKNDNAAYPPCVMVDGIIYKDTGYVSSIIGCGNMDGKIISTVDGTELPTKNNQSNFGTGYQYQGASENQLRVEIAGEKRIFRDISSDDTSIPMEVINFHAEVKEICKNGELLVTHISTAEGFREMSGGDYYVPTDNLKNEVKAGDSITIWFDGTVMETDPAQLGEVYRIEKEQ